MPVSPGDEAPLFELYGKEAGDARKFGLSEALEGGGVVLHFFPLPFTGVCQAQMCAVRDHPEAYEGVTVWGITGHYPQLIKAWDEAEHLDVPILADYDHEISTAYVGLYEDPMPQKLKYCSKRGVVGIGRDGLVKYVWVTEVSGVGPDVGVVASAVEAARS